MKRKNCIRILFSLFVLTALVQLPVKAQPFANEIAAFKKQDSMSFPPKQAILFTGSSSFTIWKDVQDYFPGYTIINRGFGGSSLTDLIHYQNDVIYPYQPKQVIIYCGENDIAGDSALTGRMVFEWFKQLYKSIKKEMPGVPICYISMKPSPSRWHWRSRMMEGNDMIRKFLTRKKKHHDKYIDVWDAMLGKDGQPLAHIFLEDKLHMNAEGYAIWQKILLPYLIK